MFIKFPQNKDDLVLKERKPYMGLVLSQAL